MVLQPNSTEEFKQIIKKGIVIVDFSATWCGPCRVCFSFNRISNLNNLINFIFKIISPYFEELSKKYPSIKFIKVDVDELEDVSSEAGVSAMPSFYVYKEGKVVEQFVGANKEKLEALVKKYA